MYNTYNKRHKKTRNSWDSKLMPLLCLRKRLVWVQEKVHMYLVTLLGIHVYSFLFVYLSNLISGPYEGRTILTIMQLQATRS